METIALGNNTVSKISGYLNTPAGSITRQLGELKDLFELIEFEMPYKSRRGRYIIKHQLLNFWFSQIYKNFSDYTSRNSEFIFKIKKGFNEYFGKRFEIAAKEFLFYKLGLTSAMRQWGKIPNAEIEKSEYGIDLISKNEYNTYVFEFKWKELSYSDSLKIFNDLKTRSKYVNDLPTNLKFGVVAKRISEKRRLIDLRYMAFDLDDI